MLVCCIEISVCGQQFCFQTGQLYVKKSKAAAINGAKLRQTEDPIVMENIKKGRVK